MHPGRGADSVEGGREEADEAESTNRLECRRDVRSIWAHVPIECPRKTAIVASRAQVRVAIGQAKAAGDRELALVLRRLDVAAEQTVRARGRLEAGWARHYWQQVRRAVRERPELASLLSTAD
jgi:hypothetical protein